MDFEGTSFNSFFASESETGLIMSDLFKFNIRLFSSFESRNKFDNNLF